MNKNEYAFGGIYGKYESKRYGYGVYRYHNTIKIKRICKETYRVSPEKTRSKYYWEEENGKRHGFLQNTNAIICWNQEDIDNAIETHKNYIRDNASKAASTALSIKVENYI